MNIASEATQMRPNPGKSRSLCTDSNSTKCSKREPKLEYYSKSPKQTWNQQPENKRSTLSSEWKILKS